MAKKVLNINYLHELCEQIKTETDSGEIYDKFSFLLGFYDVVNYNFSYSGIIWRGRICDSELGYENIKEVGFPPKELTPVNRLNEQFDPLLYSSINQYAILDEIGADEGSYVHMVGYSTIQEKPLRLGFVGEMAHTHRWGNARLSDSLGEQLRKIMGDMSLDVGLSAVYTDAFISSILQDPKASDNNYLHSRILASLLFKKQNDLDGLVYPSIALEHSMNFAIKPNAVEQKLKMSGTCVIKVKRKFNYGIYDVEIVRSVNRVDSSGNIIWKE